MKKGQCARHDSSYERHGTQCLIANFEVATGKIISPTIGDSRTEEDFISHIKNTVKTDPKAEWIIILDQLNTHKSESLVTHVTHVTILTVHNFQLLHSDLISPNNKFIFQGKVI